MADFWIKKGDRLPDLSVQCLDSNLAVINLTAATSVTFKMKAVRSATLKIDSAGTFVDRANGIVSYSWAALDTDTVGNFEGEFVVAFTGKEETFPNNRHIAIRVVEDVAV